MKRPTRRMVLIFPTVKETITGLVIVPNARAGAARMNVDKPGRLFPFLKSNSRPFVKPVAADARRLQLQYWKLINAASPRLTIRYQPGGPILPR